MKKVPIGMIIKQIVHEKNLSALKLAEKTGLTRQGVYNAYSRTSMHEGEIEKWATALGVSPEELTGQTVKSEEDNYKVSNDEVMSLIRKMFEDELREKNEQIRALQKALEQAQNLSTALLGKSPEYSDFSIIPMDPNGVMAPAGNF